MSMIRGLGLAPLALALAASAALADFSVIRRTTAPGQAVKMRDQVNLGPDCAGTAPTITFDPPPAHGTLDIRPDHWVFPKGYAPPSRLYCEGREVDGVAVWYTPAAGFHGVDQFGWSVDHGESAKHKQFDRFTGQVTVK